MGKDIALGIVIGGAVGASLGRAFDDVKSRVTGLQKQAGQARLWQNTIGETQRLQEEFRRLHLSGDAAADGVRKKLDANLSVLRQQGIEVSRLDRAYQQFGRTARSLELKAIGHQRIGEGVEQGKAALGDAARLGASLAIPTKVSADYQAIIRDIAIKSGIAGSDKEAAMSRTVAKDAKDNGIGRNELADAVNQMVGAGMDLQKALDFAPLVAKFSVGQNASSPETAKMIGALIQNAKISDPQQMQKALESIAYLGKEGSFESSDMARWFPELLAEMQKLGIVGQDSVTQLGAMLQVQMKTAGSSDQAANNLKNWLSKIGAADTKKHYDDAGIDYEAKMREAIGKGWSTVESSFVLARAYIEKIDPERAKALAAAAAKINQEQDPEKQKAMQQAFDAAMKTGDLFADMQAKAALTAYMQNADLYQKLKRNAAQATGEIEKDLADRRATSKQLWSEVGHAWDEAMRSIGDAVRPLTDWAATGLKVIGNGVASISQATPTAAAGMMAAVAAFTAFRLGKAGMTIGRGVFDIARGTLLGTGAGKLKLPGKLGQLADKVGGVLGGAAPAGVQQVFVTNWPSGFGTDLPGSGGKPTGPSKPGPVGKAGGVLGRTVGMIGKVAPYAARIGGGLAAAGAAYQAVDTFRNAKTAEQKAEGYGGAAGMLGGGLAGAKLGAIAGAFGGPIGLAIGSLAGGVIGALAGEKALGAAAKWAFVGKQPESATSLSNTPVGGAAPTVQTSAQMAAVSAALRPSAEKPVAPVAPAQYTFAPNLVVTVQGEAKDPRQIAQEIMPHLRRMFDQYQAQSSRAALHDAAHL
jgi:TP901 family phage tail tape measure protein